MSARKKKILRDQWPRVYRTPKDGKLVLCVDSRKVGFPNGGRSFWHSEAKALAEAERIGRIKDNEGAVGFADLSSAERRDAALAIAHLDGIGTLMDAAIAFRREHERRVLSTNVPTGRRGDRRLPQR